MFAEFMVGSVSARPLRREILSPACRCVRWRRRWGLSRMSGLGRGGGLVTTSPAPSRQPPKPKGSQAVPVQIPKKTSADIAAERFAQEVKDRFGIPPIGAVREAVYEGLKKKNADRNDGGDNVVGWYSPSGGWKCMRNAWYSFFQYPAESEPSGVMRMGELEEAEIEGWLKKRYGKFVQNDFPILIVVVDAGDNYEIEVPGPEDPNPEFTDAGWFYKGKPILLCVRGYTDFYLQGYNGKIRVLWEGKSTARIGGKKEASEHHIHQIAPYAKGTKAEVSRIVYYERNDCLVIMEFEVGQDQLEVAFYEAMDWFINFHGYVVRKELPPDEPVQPAWECRYCPFTAQCKADGGTPRF